MKGMRVLNIVSAKDWGGGEQYVYDICFELKNRNIENFVLIDKRYNDLWFRFSRVSKVFKHNINYCNGLVSLHYILNIIDKYNINIVNCHSGKMMPLCLMLKKLRNIKLILFKHNAIKTKKDYYHKYLRDNTDAIVCVSKLVYDLQTQGLDEIEKRKFKLIYNGIATEKFNKYRNIKKRSSKFIIGYAGRIVENKGVKILIDVVNDIHKKYSNVELLLVGADIDNYWQDLKKYIYNNNMYSFIHYKGLENDMEKFYKSIDLFILPSIVKEAFGLVLCEAMYCKVPVITSNSGAQSEIIENEVSGFIVDNLSQELEIVIEKIYKGYYDLNKISESAKNIVEQRFNIKNTVNSLLLLYSNL